jgi:streptomycin 6-kinase
MRRPGGDRLVVKITIGDPTDPDEYPCERDALRHYAALPVDPTVRSVRLLGCDDDLRLLELEQVTGERLDAGWPQAHDDAALTVELAVAMRTLWAPPAVPGRWRQLASWMGALDRDVGIDAGLRRRARDLGAELRGHDRPVLLHGDLHHENVFREPAGTLVVLDPKGVLGNRGFDVGALFWNPAGVEEHPHVIPARLEILAYELGMDQSLVQAWAWVASVLSAAWFAEDGSDPTEALAIADLIGCPC